MAPSLFVQLINLDRDTERLMQSTRLLSGMGLSFTRLPAVAGATLTGGQVRQADSALGRPLYPGETGCYLSHLNAIDGFLATDAQFGLVLEDDVDTGAAGDAAARLDTIVGALPGLPLWDVLNLGRPAKPGATRVGSEYCEPAIGLYHAHYPPVTTTAILWSRGGAREFRLLHSQPSLPIDLAIQSWGARTDRVLALSEPVFGARAGQSTIQAAGRHSSAPGLRGAITRLRRIWSNKWLARENRVRRRAG